MYVCVYIYIYIQIVYKFGIRMLRIELEGGLVLQHLTVNQRRKPVLKDDWLTYSALGRNLTHKTLNFLVPTQLIYKTLWNTFNNTACIYPVNEIFNGLWKIWGEVLVLLSSRSALNLLLLQNFSFCTLLFSLTIY